MEVVTGAGDGVSSYMFIYMVVLYIYTITDAHGGCYWCWRWSKLLHVYIYGRVISLYYQLLPWRLLLVLEME